ncbi:uncharacterized protein BDZ83DRAFT_647426 [Colletotrichum acutatum]|uniref:Secreted protein n=1 Tax=Glomerella acutata TaxID=27357 RepID=A0AAD8XM50_GLOAC|nr:uncharacterized protein BDZ83DRAFT_647426 [Colletotrichum acutatum]KAK1729859.1 hypothetical protein BDZ83DRAFT_647426 [Colletotrichum acutatum]
MVEMLCGRVASFVSVISSSVLLHASSASPLADRQDINGQQSCDETYARAESPVIVQYHLAIHESTFQLLGQVHQTAAAAGVNPSASGQCAVTTYNDVGGLVTRPVVRGRNSMA